MRRRCFILFSAISLLACLAAGGLWLRSRSVRDNLIYVQGPRAEPGRRLVILRSESGALLLTSGRLILNGDNYPRGLKRSLGQAFRWSPGVWYWPKFNNADGSPSPPPPWWARLRFGLSRHYYPDWDSGQITLAVPHWFIVLAAAASPALWLRGARRRRTQRHRQRLGLCRICGYDLRATP
ncbi:MAG TPA: hypothetical protein VIL86_14310, partial [Tepidisphaeraceae bacterium]